MPRRYEVNLSDEDIARRMVNTFKDRPVEYRVDLSFTWPNQLQNVGDSLAIAYNSDKWEKPPRGKRKWTDYKHLAESRNIVFVRKGLLYDYHNPSKSWPVVGPMEHFRDVPMPNGIADLGLFEEADLVLYEGIDEDGEPYFSDDEDENVVKVTIRHAKVGGAKIRWSKVGPYEDQIFLFVYTEKQGVHMIIIGEELDVLKDGIVG